MDQPPPHVVDALTQAYEGALAQQTWELDIPDLDEGISVEDESQIPVADEAIPAQSTEIEDRPPTVERIIEAILFVSGQPVSLEQFASTIRGVDADQVEESIDILNSSYRRQGRAYYIEHKNNSWAITLRPRFQFVAEKLFGSIREARLSQPAIDVLAVVAYRQPVTKREVDNVRGHASASLLRQLIRRGLVAVVPHDESESPELHYGTTARFLELFRLNSLDELPQTQELERL